MLNKTIISKVKSLPLLSDSTKLVHSLYSKGEANVDIIQLIRIIEADATLTVNIIRMINSPMYGFSKQISSVSQAVSLLGTDIIYSLVLHQALNDSIKADLSPYNISPNKFNDICHLQSSLMMQWFAKIDLRHSQFLTPIALMMESGKIIVASEVVNSGTRKEFLKGIRECKNIASYEHKTLGISSYGVGSFLFEHWNFEPLYPQMLKALDYPNKSLNDKMNYYVKTLDIVRTAVNVKEIFTDESIDKAAKKVKALKLDTTHFRKVATRLKVNYDKKYSIEF